MYCKTYIAIITTAFIIIAMCSLLVQSQEKGDVVIIEHSYENKDENKSESGEGRVQVFIDNGDRPAVIMKSGESGPANISQRGFGSNNNSEKRTQKREMREMNQYGGMPSGNIRNTEIKTKEGEKPGISGNAPFNAGNTMVSLPVPKQGGQIQPGQGPGAIDDKKLQSYMDVIVKKNLFMPLGSGAEAPKPSYALTAVISNTVNKSQPKAIIEQIGSNSSFYVSIGETFADGAKVIEINEKEAKVERSGEEIRLSLGLGVQGGGGKGPRDFREQRGEQRQPGGEKRSENRQMRSGMNNFDPNNIPPFVRKMLEERGISTEDIQNNPDLREKLRSEFMQRFRGGGAPQEVAPVIIEAP